MNKYEYLKELERMLEEAHKNYVEVRDNYMSKELEQYYKGRFHAFNTAILAMSELE